MVVQVEVQDLQHGRASGWICALHGHHAQSLVRCSGAEVVPSPAPFVVGAMGSEGSPAPQEEGRFVLVMQRKKERKKEEKEWD